MPLFVTVGSPLAITEIRKTLSGFAPRGAREGAAAWFNAMDERDVVALYPLDAPQAFRSIRSIRRSRTRPTCATGPENRHGIAGYLDDQEVAKRIYDALS